MDSTPASSPSSCSPLIRVNPNNPAEYCSTVPPPVQAAGVAALPPPTVMVPVGVLKKEGSSSQSKSRNEPKQVGQLGRSLSFFFFFFNFEFFKILEFNFF